MICVVEVVNTETLEHEVIAYLNGNHNERLERINEHLQKTLPPVYPCKLRWYYYETDWDDEQILFEAMQVAREQ